MRSLKMQGAAFQAGRGRKQGRENWGGGEQETAWKNRNNEEKNEAGRADG